MNGESERTKDVGWGKATVKDPRRKILKFIYNFPQNKQNGFSKYVYKYSPAFPT